MAALTDQERALLEEHLDVARSVAWRFASSETYEDVYQEAVFGLADAIRRFDPGKGASLRTYAYYRVQGWIRDWLRLKVGRRTSHKRKGANALSIDDLPDFFPASGPDPEQLAVDGEFAVLLEDALRDLQPLDRWLIEQRLDGRTMADIGDEIGVTESRVCQLLGRLRPALPV